MTLKIEGDVPGFNNCYHFHASPKYRRHAFSGDIARTIHEILESKANELGWRIYSIAVDTDHVHFLIQSEASPSEIAHRLFGYASYALRKKFPDLKEINADHLWGGRQCKPIKDQSHFDNAIAYINRHKRVSH